MDADHCRRRLEELRRSAISVERKAAEYRRREADHRARAVRERRSAARAGSPGIAAARARQADRHEEAAAVEGRKAASWTARAVRIEGQADRLERTLARLLEKAEHTRLSEQRATEERFEERHRRVEERMTETEEQVGTVLRELRAPKPEMLRVLMLGAAAGGDLRIAREQKRIRDAVRLSLHRDLVELDARLAATAEDLLDGLSAFRPHVVHFSGHSSEELIVFERDVDERHEGAIVSAEAFARAIAAVDEPPLLVLLNSCGSAAQAPGLLATVPLAIGMSGSIGDLDAIAYAARFYASVANGQSIGGAHALGRSAIDTAGLPDHELPTLFHRDDVAPRATYLVTPP
ncbi:hypothetical protein G6W57_05575 [Streptomyces sp. CAI-121]|nr:hypothetical protein [Streptomyces sp. CAI-121]NUV98464.1 hypothetical protein [Streptomyces sp. CAI 127]NUW11736.1 hypothetical protein [Streptomyces sp. CAI-68]